MFRPHRAREQRLLQRGSTCLRDVCASTARRISRASVSLERTIVTSCNAYVTMSDMPSPRHDTLIKLFSDRAQLAVEILRDLMVEEVPDTPLNRQEESTFNTRPSDDLEADLVLVLLPPQEPAHAINVENQQDK